MTGTDAFTGADLVAFIGEQWTPLVLQEFFAKSVAADHFVDLAEIGERTGSDIFHVPDVYTNSFTVQTQGTEGAEVTLGSPTQNDVTLSVTNHSYIAYILGDLERQQIASSYNVTREYTRKAGGTLREDLEGDLFALWSGLTTNSVGDTGTVLTDVEIRQAVNSLDSSDFPLDELAFFFHPFVLWNQVMGIQKYYDASQAGWGDGESPVQAGTVGAGSKMSGLRGSLYGIPVYVSTQVNSGLQTYRNLLAHRTAFGYAVQTPGGNPIRTRAAEWLANLGVLTVHDMMNGVAELRDNAAVVVNANTSATA